MVETPFFLGIDIGTSTTKSMVIDATGKVLGMGEATYEVAAPQAGWAEQDPEVWWEAAVASSRDALRRVPGQGASVAGIAVCGQMHGLVMLDGSQRVLGPAILWPDTRAAEQVARIRSVLGPSLYQRVGGPVASGFLLPSLLWVREAQPDRFRAARHVLTPKDALRLRLVGEVATDPTDACGTGVYSPASRAWADDILAAFDIPPELFPPVKSSTAVAGGLLPSAAAALGLRTGIPVVTGCGDLQASAIGMSIGHLDQVLVNVGTGGQVFQLVDRYSVDPEGRLHTMAHADGEAWHVMGSILSAGAAIKWFAAQVTGGMTALESLFSSVDDVTAAEEGLFFLPYLIGERTPHMDDFMAASFVGVRLHHDRRHLFRAVLEGVAFALRDCYEVMVPLVAPARALRAGSRALQAPAFRQIMADVFGIALEYADQPHSSVYGACILARSGIEGQAVRQVMAESPLRVRTTRPDYVRAELYDAAFSEFRALAAAEKRRCRHYKAAGGRRGVAVF